MTLINTSKPSTSFANGVKAASAELWSTITTTWATEIRTWVQMGSLITNIANASRRALGSYTFDEVGALTGDEVGVDTFETLVSTPIINTSKPS